MKSLTGSPPWRLLAILTALVGLAHALLLQATPSRLGLPLDAAAMPVKAVTTRSINAAEAAAADVLVAPPAPPPRAKRPQVVVPPTPPAESASNPPPDQVNNAQPATDLIASEPQQNLATSLDATDANATGTPSVAPLTAAPSLPTQANSGAVSESGPPANPKPTIVTAIKLPESVLLQYKMTGTSKGLNYQADAELGWTNADIRYEAFMKISALFLGSRSMTSAGVITPTGLAPTRFADKFRTELAAHFQADKGKITFSANTPDAVWLEGAQDRVSVFIQLGGMLAAKPADFPPGSEITLYTVGPRDADTWTFLVEAEETLPLAGQDMATLRLVRKPRREFDQRVEIWYAPSLGYLPVRNRITQSNGDFIDQKLSKIVKP